MGAIAPHDRSRVRRWWDWLRGQRRAARLTQRKLARALGRDQSWVSNMEDQGCIPKHGDVIQIAVALDAPISEALVMAGYVPLDITPAQWLTILDGHQMKKLHPELHIALRAVEPDEWAAVDAFLAGVVAMLRAAA